MRRVPTKGSNRALGGLYSAIRHASERERERERASQILGLNLGFKMLYRGGCKDVVSILLIGVRVRRIHLTL